MNNQLATHFRTYFQMNAADAGALAGAFGLMNLFARSLGGITSDFLFKWFRGQPTSVPPPCGVGGLWF